MAFLSMQGWPIGDNDHIMAMRLDSGAIKAKYYDPNFGESNFSSFDNFKSWFLAYSLKSHYEKLVVQEYRVR